MMNDEIKRRLAEFARLALTEQCFDWKDGDCTMRLFRIPAGSGFLIYGLISFGEDADADFAKGGDAKLIATVAGGTCYIERPLYVCERASMKEIAFPEGVCLFMEAYKEAENRVREEAVREAVEVLRAAQDPDILNMARKDARTILLGGVTDDRYVPAITITEEDFRQSLLGMLSLKEEAAKQVSAQGQVCQRRKDYTAALADELAKKTAIQPWELRMADALRKLGDDGAYTVTAGFDIAGERLTGKIFREDLFRRLMDRDNSIYGGDFETKQQARAIRKSAKAAGKELSIADITSLSYRGKVLYEKEQKAAE